MKSPTLHCVVVEVPAEQVDSIAAEDLLPWADPYIARLVLKHQLQLAREKRAAQNAYAGRGRERFDVRRG